MQYVEYLKKRNRNAQKDDLRRGAELPEQAVLTKKFQVDFMRSDELQQLWEASILSTKTIICDRLNKGMWEKATETDVRSSQRSLLLPQLQRAHPMNGRFSRFKNSTHVTDEYGRNDLKNEQSTNKSVDSTNVKFLIKNSQSTSQIHAKPSAKKNRDLLN